MSEWERKFLRHCSETTHLIPDEQTRSRLGKQHRHSMIKGKQWKANSCNFFGASLLSLVLDFLTIAHRMGPDSLPACALASLPAFSLPAYITRSTLGLAAFTLACCSASGISTNSHIWAPKTSRRRPYSTENKRLEYECKSCGCHNTTISEH